MCTVLLPPGVNPIADKNNNNNKHNKGNVNGSVVVLCQGGLITRITGGESRDNPLAEPE
jgi:hypothetical protein